MAPTENARCDAGAVSSKFGGFRSQHKLTASEFQHRPRFDGQRFERQIERLHRLGPRPMGEMLAEIATATGSPGIIADRLAAFAELDLAVIRALGADRFPLMPLTVIR